MSIGCALNNVGERVERGLAAHPAGLGQRLLRTGNDRAARPDSNEMAKKDFPLLIGVAAVIGLALLVLAA